MKKLFSNILILVFVFVPLTVGANTLNPSKSLNLSSIIFNKQGLYTNSNGVIMSITEVSNLKILQFTEEQIIQMDSDEFHNNNNLIGEVVSSEIVYYNTVFFTPVGSTAMQIRHDVITEAEYNSGNIISNVLFAVGGYHTHETTMKKLQTDIIKVVNGSKITYRLRNDLTYKTEPAIRSWDVSGIRHDPTVSVIPETAYAKLMWMSDNPCSKVCYNDSTAYAWNSSSWKRNSGTGYAVSMDLPGTTTCSTGPYDIYNPPQIKNVLKKNISSYMYYEIQKLQTTKIQTINAYGSYQHSTVTVTFGNSQDFTISSTGLGGVLNFSVNIVKKYDGMGGTHSYLSNLNW